MSEQRPRMPLPVQPSASLAACPNCGGERDHPQLRFCPKCRKIVLT